ncbi:MAG: sensor histidine kinase [Actinomycetota bacterium]|nr:sensor histidine kinase [Actinomycetota bacterium]
MLTYSNLDLAQQAMRKEVRARAATTATVSAALVQQQMQGLAELVDAFADRPNLVKALGDGDAASFDDRQIQFHLAGLQHSRKGISGAFVTDMSGRLSQVEPPTPEIVGGDFSYRDWYRGVTSSHLPYVSEAYETAIRGNSLVVAVATVIRSLPEAGPDRPLGILAVTYDVEAIRAFAEELAQAQSVRLTVTDQRGVVVATPKLPSTEQVSTREDRRVQEALDGRSGIAEVQAGTDTFLSAYGPVEGIGWTVFAEISRHAAFAGVTRLITRVLAIAVFLGALLLVGFALLARFLGRTAQREADLLGSYHHEQETVTRLQEVDRAKTDFVASVSHELRTPLTSISGYVQRLRSRAVGEVNPEQQRMLTVVERNSKRLLSLIEDLLTVSSIDSGTFRMELAQTEVASLMRDAHETVLPSVVARDLKLTVRVEPDTGTVLADAVQLERVLLNLLSNAIKFTPDGGSITLTARRSSDHVTISVSDTGSGIPAHEQAQLFTRFFRSSQAHESAVQGTGLGLAIVKAIVEQHGGRVVVESEPAVGTTVSMILPVVAQRVPDRAGNLVGISAEGAG